MRTFYVLPLLGSAGAFTISPAFVSRGAALAMTSSTHMDKSYTVGSGMTEHDIITFLENIDVDNFDKSLEMLEPLLTNECVGEICEDYIGDLREKAAQLGKTIPEGYAASHH